MNTAALHHIDCEWHHDQYGFECTCGAVKNCPASQVRDDADGATMFVPCDNCDGSGIIARRVTVYEHGCGVPHDDTDERPCPKCDGTGEREITGEPNVIHIDGLVFDALTAEREARIREVAELRVQKDAWIARLEAENERLRGVLERIANQTFLHDPAQARRVARETLAEKRLSGVDPVGSA
jgi:hypothetical protein